MSADNRDGSQGIGRPTNSFEFSVSVTPVGGGVATSLLYPKGQATDCAYEVANASGVSVTVAVQYQPHPDASWYTLPAVTVPDSTPVSLTLAVGSWWAMNFLVTGAGTGGAVTIRGTMSDRAESNGDGGSSGRTFSMVPIQQSGAGWLSLMNLVAGKTPKLHELNVEQDTASTTIVVQSSAANSGLSSPTALSGVVTGPAATGARILPISYRREADACMGPAATGQCLGILTTVGGVHGYAVVSTD